MAKEKEVATNEKYQPFTSLFVFDEDFQYVQEAHGQRNPTTGKLLANAQQDPKIGAKYISIKDDVEGLINMASAPGGVFVFDLPSRGNTLINSIQSDINKTFKLWSADVQHILIVTPLLNPEKSVLAAEKQAMEYLKLQKTARYAVHFVFVVFPESKHYSQVRKEFDDSNTLKTLSAIGTVTIIELNNEFNTELPTIISGSKEQDIKAWKIGELAKSKTLAKFTNALLEFFIEDVINGFKPLLADKLPKSADERGVLIMFASAEGGVRKSTIAGMVVEYLRGELTYFDVY